MAFLERLSVSPRGSEDLCAGVWARLNARAASLLLSAMNDELKNDMVALRITQDSVKMMFRLYIRFQPGGAAERADILRRLQAPTDYLQGDSLENVLKALRLWPRLLARCRAVHMTPPDPTVLSKGLLSLTDRYISSSADSSFRTAMLRTTLRLDAQPSLEQVQAYQKHLQAELEVLHASTSVSSTLSNPKLRAVDASGTHGRAKDKEKDRDKGQELCKYFSKPSGCKRGDRCAYSHSMTHLDREARSRKCLKCGSEAHRQRDCQVANPKSSTTTANKPEPKASTSQASTMTNPSMSVVNVAQVPGDGSPSASTVSGTPWTLEALVQAAHQVVQAQGLRDGSSSPEKTETPAAQLKVLNVKDIHVCSIGDTAAALLDSGATHCLRSARSPQEWDEAEEVLVQLAGCSSLVMRLGLTGSLLMPPKTSSKEAQTIVPMGELVKVLGYTLVWGPDRCFLEDSRGQRTPLSTASGCPQLLEAEALSMIARTEYRRREQLENQAAETQDRIALAAVAMERWWKDYLREYVATGSKDAGGRALRDAPFLQGLPAECLEGLIQDNIEPGSWRVMKEVDFLTRPERRYLWNAKRWVVHLFAGNPGHYQFFQIDDGNTVVLELDISRNRGQDILKQSTWRLLLWGALTGKIEAVVGGPPGRGGLYGDDLDTRALRSVTRMLWLYAVAKAAQAEVVKGPKRTSRWDS